MLKNYFKSCINKLSSVKCKDFKKYVKHILNLTKTGAMGFEGHINLKDTKKRECKFFSAKG
jgi:hypothetical protein